MQLYIVEFLTEDSEMEYEPIIAKDETQAKRMAKSYLINMGWIDHTINNVYSPTKNLGYKLVKMT